MKTCYMCRLPATGDEHVPPKCIFPKEAKYRVNLITVPSCDEHNLRKSHDDEYLKFLVAGTAGVNALGQQVFGDSVMRSFDYRPQLIDKFMPDLAVIRAGELEGGAFNLDWPRFQRAIASVVRALYWHEVGERLTTNITGAVWAPMLNKDYSEAPFLKNIALAERLHSQNTKGTNPEIFQYGFGSSKKDATSFCRLRFYEGHPIYATWKSGPRPER
jgi:hypothetical protein